MIVYANGCSFGLPPASDAISYSQIIAENLNAQLINKHVQGTGNRRLVRTSLRDLIELRKKSDEKILALIGLSFFSRTELWRPDLPATGNDGHFHSIRDISREYNNDPIVQDWIKQSMIWQNKESIITEQLADIIMFSSFCCQQDIDYLIWNNADYWPGPPEVNVTDVFLKDFVEYAINKINLIDPWKFAFLPWALEQGHEVYSGYGHPGQEAHKRLADFLLEKIKEIK